MEKSVGIWIRVSTEDQVKGESPEHHERRARAYAEVKGWTAKEVYRLDAVSGKSVIEHPESKRMLGHIKNGHISALIFSKLARLARNTKELLEFAERFRESNAELISLQESIDTSTPAGRLFYTMISAMAHWEREEIAERVAASVPIRAKLGKKLSGQSSFGYRWDDKKLVIDLKEAPIRKLMYELFIEHKRKKTVARLLNEAGHRTRVGAKFTGITIHRLLRDTTAKGIRRANYTKSKGENKWWTYKPESDWVLLPAPAIVKEEIWDECNRILDEQERTKRVPSRKTVRLFSGLLFCHCGTKMYVPTKSYKYTCPACHNKVGEADIEDIFHEQLKSFLFSESELTKYIEKGDGVIQEKVELLANMVNEAASIRNQLDTLVQLNFKGELPSEGFGRHYGPPNERLNQLESKIPELQAEIDFLKIQQLSGNQVIDDARNLHNSWPRLSREEKRQIVETITDKVVVDKSDITINLSYLPHSAEMVSGREHKAIRSTR